MEKSNCLRQKITQAPSILEKKISEINNKEFQKNHVSEFTSIFII